MRANFRVFLSLAIVAGLIQPALAEGMVDGARLADACSSCHGLEGAGGDAIPAIAGLPVDDFVARMTAFRDQSAPATIMNRLARGFTDSEIVALATYFSELEAK